MSDNPYQSDFSGTNPNSDLGSTMVGDQMRLNESLISIARWQAFFGFLGALFCFLIFVSVGIQVLFLIGLSGLGSVEAVLSSGFAILVLVAYGLPTAKLIKASQSARACAMQGKTVAEMIDDQRAFWRILGIVVCATVGLYVAAIVFAILIGVSMYNFF
ncbi:hypothetical protein SH449x_000128 [Pirellulaceae bacterium SH449]